MEASQTLNKILKLAQDNNSEEKLQSFCKLKLEKVIDDLPQIILRNDGRKILDCIFTGLPDIACPIKIKVIDMIFKTVRKEEMSLTHCADLISRVCLELPKMPVDHLVRWSSSCVQCIIEDSDVNMIWRDILPECLNAVSTYDVVTTSGTEMSGMEFKVQCIHTLCQCNWTERQLVQLAAMFKDFQMHHKNSPWPEHKQVVNKLCNNIMDIPPETLPPLVHQMLILCKLYNAEIVLSHLSHYFNIQLYSKLEPPPNDTESTTMDLDDIVQYSPAELSRCLSTCLYHITQGKADPELIRKHIKQWSTTQLLRAPFVIDLALAVSNKGSDFKSVCLDVIKSAIELRILDELRSKESAWVRSVLPPDVDIVNVLKVLTTESGNHRQITVLGLINLAFSLLSVSRTKPTAPSCWSHGKLILVRLCSAQPETASHILGQLSDRLFSDQNLQQYTDCLHVLCKLTPVSVERCTKLITILENCQPLGSYEHSAKTYEAVSPLISFSTRVRDTLVMVCRKGLYSRDTAHRCLALSGFLTVLRYVKLSKKSVLSQTSSTDDYSGHSYLTQITVDMHATSQGSQVTSRMRNETICLEVISILRRSLSQDADVKQLLYTELYDCVKEKQALYEPILELFYEHLTKYMPEEGGTGLSLDLCVQEKPTAAILTEPMGRLIYIIAQFLQATEDNDTEDILGSQNETYMMNKLMENMEKLCKIDLQALINMEDIGLTDLTTESKAKQLKVQQIIQCYEAFIGHYVMQWTQYNTNAASVYGLYKASNELLENAKATPKSKKVGTSQAKDTQKSPKKTQKGGKGSKTKPISQTDKSDKSKSSTQSSSKSQKSQTSPQKTNAPIKVSNLVKNRAGPFKPLPCLWDMNLCIRILHLLYSEEVSWSSVEQRNYIRSKRDFHIFALRNIQSVLENVDKRAKVKILQIADILYKRCISRFRDMCDFDDRTTLACLELFKLSLNLLLSPNFSLKIDSVLTGITDIMDKPGSASLAEILQKIYTALTILESEAAEEDLDIVRKKILVTLVQTTCTLLEAPVVACNTLHEVILKLEEYVTTSKQVEVLPLLSALLTASSRDQREATLLPQLLLKLRAELGDIDDEESSSNEESPSEFPTIDLRTGHSVLSQVCVHLSSRFKFAEHLLNRARDLSNALTNSVPSHQKRIDKELKELYKTIVIEFCQLARWTSKCAQLRCCIGGGSDKVISNCVRLYSLLAMLVKQLDPPMATFLRLERLLKYTGKELSSVTDKLITYLESSQQQPKASKVLRDTKLIPRLVFEAEQFSKRVILLGVKANLNFQQYLSLGTARDFKIKAPILQQVLDIREPEEEAMDVDDNISEAPTEVIAARSDVEEDVEDEGPTPKKNKKS